MPAITFTGSYVQNFDSLAASGTGNAWSNGDTLEGWSLFRQPTPGTALATYAASTGTATAGAFYSFGSGADRALGGLGSGGTYFGSPAGGSVAGWFALAATNASGSTIDELTLRFDGEQWRNGGNTSAQTMVLEFGFGADFTGVATWNAAGTGFDFTSPVATASAAAVDGNTAGRVADLGGTLSGLGWDAGETLWLRWVERNDSGNDHGLALDNLRLTAVLGSPDLQITEFMYDGAPGEFIELTNLGSAALDLAGYSFDDSSRQAGSFPIGALGVVQPGQSVIITETDAASFRAAWNLGDDIAVLGGLTHNLGRGDEMNIYDAAGQLVDRLTYGDQVFVGTVRTQNASASTPLDKLGADTIDTSWSLSTPGDSQNAITSGAGTIGSPGHYNNGTPGVWITASGGSSQVTEGGGGDTYTLALRGAPAADVEIQLDAGSQLLATPATLTFTPANWSVPQGVTLAAVDDAAFEGPHTGQVHHAVVSIDPAYDGLPVADLAVSIVDNDVARPQVNLSVSADQGSEAEATVITVTATLSQAVPARDQTVQLSVAGSGIDAADFYLSGSELRIPAGATSASVSFIVADDARAEGNETAQLTIGSPSSDIELGSTTQIDILLVDHVDSLLTKVGAASSSNGAEISAFDAGSDRLFVVAGPVLEVYTMASDGTLTPTGTLPTGFSLPAGHSAVPNSVATKNGLVAVAWAVVDDVSHAQGRGQVTIYDAATGTVHNSLTVGYLPDMLAFSADGGRIVVANEGEPNSYGQDDSFDPEGSISLIDLSSGVNQATVAEAGFTGFDDDRAALQAAGVRIFGPGASVAMDLEPEYVTIAPDGGTAVVTLQEANAVAVVDLASATVTTIASLGTKDFSLPGNGFDASDRDGGIHIQSWPVRGMYQPDAIAQYTVGGQTYFITANEGDSRAYTGFSEEIRVGAADYVLDPIVFPDAAALKANDQLGRLQLTRASGDTDGDGDFDQILAFGARSFTIWNSAGTPVYDSGDDLEQITALRTPTLFNSDGSAASFDTRSDNKGPEPEGVTIGQIGGRSYAFVGLERVGDVIVYDVTEPTAPQFVQLINTPEDLSPEGLLFVPAADSPTGAPLLVTSNEVSRTVAVFEIDVPLRIADVQGAGHVSPLVGQGVTGIAGKVTAIAGNGFYIQDPTPDADDATSDAIFVFTGSGSALLSARRIGEAVKVSGTVSEFRPGGDADNLSTTEIVHNAGVQALSVSAWTDAPAGAIVPLVLGVDRNAPTEVIQDDFAGTGDVETGGDFDPAHEGIDFYESLEGMLVRVDGAVATSPTNAFGEIWVLPNGGADASGLTARGGSLVSLGDFNPERLQLDNLLGSQTFPQVDVGAMLDPVTGVIDYAFNNFELRTLAAPTVAASSPLSRETTALDGSADGLTVATFNVENLDPGDGAAKFAALAQAIVNNLRAPDILTLEEVQDNDGPTNSSVVDADQTLALLIDAIEAAGGPTYAFRQLNPVDDQDGGEPGGNIRVAFLYDPARVDFVDGSLQRLRDGDLSDGDAFANSRKPLVGDFVFNGQTVTVVANHFNSKGGDGPLFGPTQPPVLASEPQRLQQAGVVADFVQGLLDADAEARVIVAGDLNDFEFSAPLAVLQGAGLTSLVQTLPAAERYTYNFEGNAQTLDHIMVSPALLAASTAFDIVHINSEFATQVSDHDPSVALFDLPPDGQVIDGSSGRDILQGTPGDDVITGDAGRDQIAGGRGADRFVYTSLVDAGDRIADFELGVDRLVIDALMASVGHAGADPVAEGFVGVASGTDGLLVSFDADGAAGPGAPRLLVELVGLASATPAELLDPSPVGT